LEAPSSYGHCRRPVLAAVDMPPRSRSVDGGGGCGCLALFHKPPARPSGRGDKAPEAQAAPTEAIEHAVLRQQVQEMVAAEMKGLEDSLSKELQSVFGRLLKAEAAQHASAPTSRRSSVPSCPSPEGDAHQDEEPLPLRRLSDPRRRWTIAADGVDSLKSFLRGVSPARDEEDENELPAHVQRRKNSGGPPRFRLEVPQQDDDEGHRMSSKSSTASDDGRRRSLSNDSPRLSVRSEHELPVSRAESVRSSGSSVVWRIDALDCGDRLAASAAAKKGGADIDSIVDLVGSERERWAEERLALEARLEELKEQRQAFRRAPDPEKAELKRKVQELRETMRVRSRFGAWVCERHMQESDDEEESPSNLEKEQLRGVLAGLEAELREARVQAAVATMEP